MEHLHLSVLFVSRTNLVLSSLCMQNHGVEWTLLGPAEAHWCALSRLRANKDSEAQAKDSVVQTCGEECGQWVEGVLQTQAANSR